MLRFDASRIGTFKRTPQGGLDVLATPARVGVLTYHFPDGTSRREFCPPEEVFKADSLASLAGAPVTVGHHPENNEGIVSPENWGALATGTVADTVKQSGPLVETRLRVQRKDAVEGVESSDLCELSCGYRCDFDPTPGEWNGERYDGIQRNRVYNHVALLPKNRARAGRDTRIRQDGIYSEMDPDLIHSDNMDLAEALKEIERLKGELTGHKTRADAAETALKGVDVDALVKDKVALLEDARKVLGASVKLDGMSDVDLLRAVVTKAYPETKLDDKTSEDFLRGLFTAAVSSSGATKVAKLNVRQDGTSVSDKIAEARKRNDERSANAWRK